jgi:tetratricopeptide (TPR) repeat protein
VSSLADVLKAMDEQDFKGALIILESLDPADDEEQGSILFYSALCREKLGCKDTEELVSCYETSASLARDPTLGGNASFRAGWLLLNAGEQVRAESALARSIDRLSAAGIENALFCHAAFWQAVCWERAGRYLDAAPRYRKVAALDSTLRPECVYRQIQCLTAVGALKEASTVCEQADQWLGQDCQPRSVELRRLIAQEYKTLRTAMDAA